MEETAKMINITINYPEVYHKLIWKLVKLGIYPNRSQVLRNAISDFLSSEFNNIKNMEDFLDENSDCKRS